MLTFAGRRLFWADARTFFPSSLGRSYQLKPGQPWYLRSCPTYSAWLGKIKKALLFSLKSRSRDFPQIFPSNVHAYPQKTKTNMAQFKVPHRMYHTSQHLHSSRFWPWDSTAATGWLYIVGDIYIYIT